MFFNRLTCSLVSEQPISLCYYISILLEFHMIVSSTHSLKKLDPSAINTMLLRTDGFKNVFRGLTYKHTPSKPQGYHSGTYSSIGKRTPAKEYHLTKDSESHLDENEKSRQLRRTQTADVGQRERGGDEREKEFLRSEKEEN